MKRNSFSNSSVWNLEYGLRFLRTVTWPVHSSALDGVHEPTEPTPTVDGRPAVEVKKYGQHQNKKWISTDSCEYLCFDFEQILKRMNRLCRQSFLRIYNGIENLCHTSRIQKVSWFLLLNSFFFNSLFTIKKSVP